MYRVSTSVLLVIGMLAGCTEGPAAVGATSAADAAAAPAAATVLPAGTYDWQLAQGCGRLIIAGGNSYQWDRGCDGSIDYRASPRMDGDLIRIDQARLKIDSVTETGFTGTWRLRNSESQIVATRS